ncbi:MAG: penicillin-binding protein 1C [Bacteroidetes bacterium HGW-Bacteroidetes-4]|jgi:penicillin-binding protein 1C|nr:MAG: penicillin-binding protein 1C [Bacteroidetes bacterium HGW-Bacteroidetes-4]
MELLSSIQKLKVKINLLFRSVIKKLKFVHFIGMAILSFLLYLILPFSQPFFSTDYSVVVADEAGRFLRVFLNKQEQWCFSPQIEQQVPEKLKKAVTLFEDEYYYRHPGVNPVSVIRALKQNLNEGKIVSGASTLTMQVARIRQGNKRTYWNKLKELAEAFKLEVHFTKDELLKLYLDHAPYGANIQGYQAASYRYFGKNPSELSWAEAATLAVLPNAPGLIFPSKKNHLLKEKRDRLLLKLHQSGAMDKTSYELAALEPVPNSIYIFGMAAAHFAQFVKSKHTDETYIRTTLNFDLQHRVESLISWQAIRLRNQGIKNVALLVAETQSGKIKAYAGSQDFFDFEFQGQVNGVLAPRSSGSVLKPFLYALAIDGGLIMPQTLVKDVPTYFNAFSPHNADEKFYGMVTAQEALVRSLNVPAVRLLNAFGVYQFYTFLKQAGVTTLFREADNYGLPLIIGGAEVNLFEMALLYRGLANYGTFSPLIYQDKDSSLQRGETKSLISPAASYLTLQMLNELKRPGLEYHWQKFQHQRQLAWKTGTSYGHKDAWAIGVSPEWTIAVWVGNFDGEGNAQLAGTTSAGPLLFDVFNALPHNPDTYGFNNPLDDIKTLVLCRETGYLAGQHCIHTDTVEAPIYMEPLRLCPYHHTIQVNADETMAVCSHCWKPGHHAKKVLSFPPDVVHQLRLRGQVSEKIPSHNPECGKQTAENPMQFIYPKDSSYLWLPRDFDGAYQKLVCRLAHTHPEKQVFWYLNDVYMGTSRQTHNKAIEFSTGWQKLKVTDDEGNSHTATFFVESKKE